MASNVNTWIDRKSIIFLVSQDQTLQEEIASSIPSQSLVEIFPTIDSIPSRQDLLSGTFVGVLLDWAVRDAWKSRLAGINRKGMVLLAILNDPMQRSEAFQVGVDDFLLRPILKSELAVRLAIPRSEITVEQAGLISVGRLTSRLCHEINNSLQAARGAVALALEEPTTSDDLTTYLNLCNGELQRVITLTSRMRNIYSPDSQLSSISLNNLLNEIVYLTADYVILHGVTLETDFPLNSTTIMSNYDLLFLAILSLVLNLCAGMHPEVKSNLRFTLSRETGNICLFLTIENHHLRFIDQAGDRSAISGVESISLSPAREMLAGLGIQMKVQQEGEVSRILLNFQPLPDKGGVSLDHTSHPDRG